MIKLKNILLAVVGLAIALFSPTVINFIDILSPINFLMIYVFLICLYSSSNDIFLIASSMAFGFVYDVLLGRYEGYYMLNFFLISIILTYLKNKLLKEKVSAMFFICFLMILLNALLNSIVISLPNISKMLSSDMVASNLTFIIENSIATLVIITIMTKTTKQR